MPTPAEDVIDLTGDSEPEDDVRHPAAVPRPNRAHIPLPLSEAARQQLCKTIETCPEDTLRETLVNMVMDGALSAPSLLENLVAVNSPPLPAPEHPVDLVQSVEPNQIESAPNTIHR